VQLHPREHRLFRLLLGLLGFGVWGYCLVTGGVAFVTNHSLAGLAIAVAGAGMFGAQVSAMRNPKWPQRLW
jgi:hypothetical protein